MLDPVVKCLADPVVLDGILALTALYNLSDRNESNSEQSLPHTHTGRQAFESVRIALRLAQLTPVPRAGNGNWHSDFQNCLRLTAVLFTWTFARRVNSRWEAVSSVQSQLRALLTTRLLSAILFRGRGNPALSDLVLWILVVSGSTTSHHENIVYYAELVRSCFPESKVRSYEDMKRIGETLPWIDVQDDAPVEEFWNMVTAESAPSIMKGEETWHSGPLLCGFVKHRNDSPKS